MAPRRQTHQPGPEAHNDDIYVTALCCSDKPLQPDSDEDKDIKEMIGKMGNPHLVRLAKKFYEERVQLYELMNKA